MVLQVTLTAWATEALLEAMAMLIKFCYCQGCFLRSKNEEDLLKEKQLLTKFRYESRKKLAEQRPRVKGQFVRQVHIDPSPAEHDQPFELLVRCNLLTMPVMPCKPPLLIIRLPSPLSPLASLLQMVLSNSIKSPKHCAKRGLNVNKLSKKLFFAFTAFFTTLLSLILLIWLILRPAKPENPNQKVGIYYESYKFMLPTRGQQITVVLPPSSILPRTSG
ncbi:hypothetical protein NC653_028508 [Populus alba x Populus x berolinensis]|uniref:CCT domain-containing protein n=1 Tax=Populus alba x Populus x berolinensis TaxID=444605 RepID=A0AAD6Q2B1_9ROSI|nr:hypothetical protein NC653_028508 [Populus alba x Populus x berolinensis]